MKPVRLLIGMQYFWGEKRFNWNLKSSACQCSLRDYMNKIRWVSTNSLVAENLESQDILLAKHLCLTILLFFLSLPVLFSIVHNLFRTSCLLEGICPDGFWFFYTPSLPVCFPLWLPCNYVHGPVRPSASGLACLPSNTPYTEQNLRSINNELRE